jgi:hypothetical protein
MAPVRPRNKNSFAKIRERSVMHRCVRGACAEAEKPPPAVRRGFAPVGVDVLSHLPPTD